ncbi:MAG: ATP-dependent sacrificial sulfur transferase LarE [Thermodesulfobacteriota bacterium]|nr:ATP-dependent sacrificial sulfur transferase LarE [Thermodesulfobacteriota bacterium]
MKPMEKHDRLITYLKSLETCVVAFSGGLDSAFLLKSAGEALKDNVLAITVAFPYIPRWELIEAQNIARELKITHIIIEAPIPEEILYNPSIRCYICKKNMLTLIMEEASKRGFTNIIEGTNADDLDDYRPGMRALEELQIKSPLLECRFTKEDIRIVSREIGLSSWDKPPYSCLLTRIPHGTEITLRELEKIEKSERYLMDIGFKRIRVRSHGNIARIEFARGDRKRLFDEALLDTIAARLKEYGYTYVAMELEGYIMGSMNEPKSN